MKLCDCILPSCCYGGLKDEVICVRQMSPRAAEQDREQVAMAQEVCEMDELKEKLKTVAQTLVERGTRYGDFSTHAQIAQDLQARMRITPNWSRLSADKKQALTTISDKIARILNGDPEYTDNWHDIAGYAKLAEDRCKSKLTG